MASSANLIQNSRGDGLWSPPLIGFRLTTGLGHTGRIPRNHPLSVKFQNAGQKYKSSRPGQGRELSFAVPPCLVSSQRNPWLSIYAGSRRKLLGSAPFDVRGSKASSDPDCTGSQHHRLSETASDLTLPLQRLSNNDL